MLTLNSLCFLFVLEKFIFLVKVVKDTGAVSSMYTIELHVQVHLQLGVAKRLSLYKILVM